MVPGDVVPVDGIVIEQPAWVRLDWITERVRKPDGGGGESRARRGHQRGDQFHPD